MTGRVKASKKLFDFKLGAVPLAKSQDILARVLTWEEFRDWMGSLKKA